MSLTSYRAAPPRDKPLRAFEKTLRRNELGPRPRAPINPVRRLPEKATPSKCPWVRAVCTNAKRLWKGPRSIFWRFYDGRSMIRTDHAPVSCFDAFSLREPVSTPDQVRGRLSLENALAQAPLHCLHPSRRPRERAPQSLTEKAVSIFGPL